MEKFKGKYRIESNRWQFWDYSAPGYYFLTNCILNRECILGDIKNGEMRLSNFGEIAQIEILKMPYYHPRVILDEWIIMPNHIHMIIELGDYDYNNGLAPQKLSDNNIDDTKENNLLKPNVPTASPPWWYMPNYTPTKEEIIQYRRQRRKMLISLISGKMKMNLSKEINIINKTPGKRNWQRDYHDHVIRDSESYYQIKNYIINNPKNWDNDRFYN